MEFKQIEIEFDQKFKKFIFKKIQHDCTFRKNFGTDRNGQWNSKTKAELNKQREQMKQMTVQKQAETSALQNQFQQLKFKWQQQQYHANIFIIGPPVFPNTTYPIPTVHPNQSSLNSSLIQELPYSLNMETQINKQHHLNMAPLMMGKIQSNFTHGLMTLKDYALKVQWYSHPPLGPWQFRFKTEDQPTQDNAPPTPSDTPKHPKAYPDTELDFEHDSELDSEDLNILAIESTDTLDNPIDNDPIGIKDNILPVVDNNTQDFNSPIDFNDHNNSMLTQAETNNSDPTFDNVHNSSISDCTDIKQTKDNSDIGDPNESKTETIDDNMQD